MLKTVRSSSYLTPWRSPRVRAVFYQAVLLAGVLVIGYQVFRATLRNLAERKISSGFGFLKNESSFAIGETVPIPHLERGFLYLLLALAGGLVFSVLLSRWLGRRRKTLVLDAGVTALVLFLVVVVPGLVLYRSADAIRAEHYTPASNYGVALITGLLNTLKVSLVGCVLASLLGLLIGLARLSSNWLVRLLGTVYVEIIRNVPLLLQILFWYFAVLRSLPGVRQSLTLGGVVVLNNHGIYLPRPVPDYGLASFGAFSLLAAAVIFLLLRHARRVREGTGRQIPVLYPSLALLFVLPGVAWVLAGPPCSFAFPVLAGFNYRGGIEVTPEYGALLLSLVLYTAAFIAEIIRSGVTSVSRGQREAALALGLTQGKVFWLIVLPQALRVMVPPLTIWYLSLTKDSSLGIAIGYPEIVSVSGTIINQSGQVLELMGITMAVYMTFSLLTSLFMNWFNVKVQLVES